MHDIILSRLESARKELLDLGLRNPLLNYKPSAARGVHIEQERSSSIYQKLVKQNKAMSFSARQSINDIAQEPEIMDIELEEAYSDNKLQTNESEAVLQNRLLNTYYAARTSLEEQGVNILYLALGFLHWFEPGNSGEEKLAPLVLIPVSLERSSARERFSIRYTLGEVEGNLSLQAKLVADFDLAIPGIPDSEELDVKEYIDEIRKAVKHIPKWKVESNAIELGFFSFGKFLIYHDLDTDQWPEDGKPVQHPILQSLLGDGFTDPQPSATEESFIDMGTEADNLYQVVDADSSQILAMLAVHEGRNLVIQGPPGTGKSQTITNMIANAIGHGRKVLFVAEKMAALEVVKRRLDEIHLGEACLELHSHKANKKELHEELRRMMGLGKPSFHHFSQEVALLQDYKDELNAYCNALNQEAGNSGLTAHEIIGYTLQLSEHTKHVKLPEILLPGMENWDAEKMHRVEALADRIQARLKESGSPASLLFWGCGLRGLMPKDQELLLRIIQQALSNTEMLKTGAEAIAMQMGLPVPESREKIVQLNAVLQFAAHSPNLTEIPVKNEKWFLNRQTLTELLEAGKKLAALHLEYLDIFLPGAWNEDVSDIRRNLVEHGDKWHKFLIASYRKSCRQLAAICKNPLPVEWSQKLKYADDILEAGRLLEILEEHAILANGLFGNRWQHSTADWDELITISAYLAKAHEEVLNGNFPKEFLDYLGGGEAPVQAQTNHALLSENLELHETAVQQVVEKMSLDEDIRFEGKLVIVQSYHQQLRLFSSWVERLPEIHQVISWNNLSDMALSENLQGLITASLSWEQAASFLKPAVQKKWYEYGLAQAYQQHSALQKFERASHEEAINKFKKLDVLNLQLNRAKVALKHWENIPRLEAGGQINVLRKEFNKKARHMPIRKLMQEAGLAIQVIKPVFMMSPLSIANFIPPGSLEFDLVIFDEASQVRPVEALGAMLRGKQLVVVGDARQLPPTSFFDTLTKETEDDENVTSDLQSILGLCDAQGAPQRMLRWHYRSRHESLINLSNHEFYENKLVIFPGPGTGQQMGLVFHHVKDTVYDRGKTRTNPKEAEIVADAVIKHATKHPRLSLGVVAFSTAQMQAIQLVLETRRRMNPELESFFKNHSPEPFFVKNLENVQGDERDVIFISIGYGRTQDGQVNLSFGPLNNEGGERRLNVLITRAKQRCEVFTNITSDDIDLKRTRKYGIHALKSFLFYAQFGELDIPEQRILPEKRPFEENIAFHLEKRGYLVKKKIGSEGMYIDLAIVDPEDPGRYIIGIMCDGAAYQSARSARDRDRLRMEVLENMGWRIQRVWSVDWLKNPERELNQLVEAIEKARELVKQDDEEPEASIPLPSALLREGLHETEIDLPEYELAVVPEDIGSQELHLHPIGKLANWLGEVVKTESPIHFDEAARRLVEAAGMTRVGPRIRDNLKLVARFAEGNGRISIKGDFLWHAEMQTPMLRNRSSIPASSRKFRYIAPEEISLAVEKVVRNSIAIQVEAAVPFIAKMFGFSRVTEDMRKDIMVAIENSVEQNIVQQDGGFLKAIS